MTLPKRIIIKFSGENLQQPSSSSIFHICALQKIAETIISAHQAGIEIGVVVGAGNIFRGKIGQECHLNRVSCDHIGMLATMINSLFIQEALLKYNIPVHVVAPMPTLSSIELYSPMKAKNYLLHKEIVIFAGGTGNPFLTTDSSATLKALEVEADLLIKATKVAGVYSKDPITSPDALWYPSIAYDTILNDDLRIMDHTAIALARDYHLPIFVYKFGALSLLEALSSPTGGTYIRTPSNQ